MGSGSGALRSNSRGDVSTVKAISALRAEPVSNSGLISYPSCASALGSEFGGECSSSGHYVYDPIQLPGQLEPPTSFSLSNKARMQRLESLVQAQALQLEELRQTLGCVRRDARCTVSVLQYNILASYLGRNTQPWFLYGAEISNEVRAEIFQKYYERAENGAPKHQWPQYVEGILTPDEIANVEARDLDFNWDARRHKLTTQIRNFDADVVSLVEDCSTGLAARRASDRIHRSARGERCSRRSSRGPERSPLRGDTRNHTHRVANQGQPHTQVLVECQ